MEHSTIKIALAGNPNCGKTTMFNALTGSSQYVGNWPGVTVEKKEGKLKNHKDVIVTDLPGIYSLSPYTPEEVVARNYLLRENPNAIINLIDGTNLERNLYLTSQLLETGIPVVVALNMADILEKRGESIDVKALKKALQCEVISVSAVKNEGVHEAAELALKAAEQNQPAIPFIFDKTIESALESIGEILGDTIDDTHRRWHAIKVFERDEKELESLNLSQSQRDRIEKVIEHCETLDDDDSESIITDQRYQVITGIMKQLGSKQPKHKADTMSDKIDRIVTNRFLALPIFAAVICLVYFLAVTTVGAWGTDWVNDVLFGEIIPPAVESGLTSIGCADWLSSLILDGIIGGVGAVLGFLPQMLVLFFLLSLLEDCGYMARIAFIMDRIFRKFGLSGKSFIPILIGTGCGVPGVMASRTIENECDRRLTIVTTTFIPCGAKLPIIALIAGALFDGAAWVAPSAYFIGVAAIICSGIILKKTRHFAGEPAPFVMELPAYHVPRLKGVIIHMWDRTKSFVKKAGTIIFLACGVIWFLSSFNWSMDMVDTSESMLASIGRVIAPLFTPLGWGDWQSAVAAITGLVAKENVVGTFGVLFGFAEVAEDGMEVWASLQGIFTPLSAFSFLIFNLLCAPCFAAIGAIRREMGSGKLTWFAIGYQTVLAYAVSFTVYRLGLLFTGGGFTFATALAIIVALIFFYFLLRPTPKLQEQGLLKKDKGLAS